MQSDESFQQLEDMIRDHHHCVRLELSVRSPIDAKEEGGEQSKCSTTSDDSGFAMLRAMFDANMYSDQTLQTVLNDLCQGNAEVAANYLFEQDPQELERQLVFLNCTCLPSNTLSQCDRFSMVWLYRLPTGLH